MQCLRPKHKKIKKRPQNFNLIKLKYQSINKIKFLLNKKQEKKTKDRNATFIIFFITLLQQILSSKLLETVNGGKKNNFNNEFKLEPVIT